MKITVHQIDSLFQKSLAPVYRSILVEFYPRFHRQYAIIFFFFYLWDSCLFDSLHSSPKVLTGLKIWVVRDTAEGCMSRGLDILVSGGTELCEWFCRLKLVSFLESWISNINFRVIYLWLLLVFQLKTLFFFYTFFLF